MKTAASLLSIPFFLSHLAALVSAIDCKQTVPVNGRKYDLSKLDSVHSVYSLDESRAPSISNTTWNVNICRPLPIDKKIPKADQCAQGTTVCGTVRTWNPEDDPDKEKVILSETIPVAGHWAQNDGKGLEYKWTRLKDTDSSEDGLQLELWGKKYGGSMQKAVIHLQCDPKRTGNDDAEDEDDTKRAAADEDDDKDTGRDLQYVSYGDVDTKDGMMKVLRLNWRTKYACENYKDGNGRVDASEGWGFFTWFILIAFLGIAAYLIFGSWLNYNRYGARGWDLLPHGDTIRDIPYLMKGWGRKVVDTVSGGGPRGGYSAV